MRKGTSLLWVEIGARQRRALERESPAITSRDILWTTRGRGTKIAEGGHDGTSLTSRDAMPWSEITGGHTRCRNDVEHVLAPPPSFFSSARVRLPRLSCSHPNKRSCGHMPTKAAPGRQSRSPLFSLVRLIAPA